MGHKCYDLSDYNKTHQSGFLQFKRKPVQKYVKKFNPKNGLKKQSVIPTYQMEESSDVTSGWAVRALSHPKFGSSVNPIPTRGADYAHHITACPPGFENLTASLSLSYILFQIGTKAPLKSHNPTISFTIFNFLNFRLIALLLMKQGQEQQK